MAVAIALGLVFLFPPLFLLSIIIAPLLLLPGRAAAAAPAGAVKKDDLTSIDFSYYNSLWCVTMSGEVEGSVDSRPESSSPISTHVDKCVKSLALQSGVGLLVGTALGAVLFSE